MDWDDLRHFLAAYRSGSLAGAARALGCEYTTVGRRIAALEAALGTTLFKRTPEGLTPTPAATELMPLAEQIEQATHTIARRAAGHDERIEGVVRLTCAEGFSAYIVDQLADLRTRHPDLTVEVIADLRSLDLLRGEADLALRLTPSTQQDLVTRALCEMPWRMVATAAYVARRGVPSPLTDLHGHEVVGFDDALVTIPGARWLADHGEGATVVCRGNSVHAVRDAAAAGLGLTVLPHFFAARDPRLQRLSEEVLGARTMTLVVHPALTQVARVRAVMDFLVEVITRDAASGYFG